MRTPVALFLSTILLTLPGCSPVKVPATNQYQLSSYSTKQWVSKPHSLTLLVSLPEASAGYQTEQMLYVKKPFKVDSFAKNIWLSPPGNMLHPLLIQSIQKAGVFYAVTSSSYNEAPDYQLDTQLFTLQQNFQKKPSVIEFSAKVVLTDVRSKHITGSKIISYQIPCPTDTPEGGVFAANKATQLFTASVTKFVIQNLDKPKAL